MSDHNHTMLKLLRSFVQNTPVTMPEDTDWEELFHMASINGTTGILGYLVMSNPGIAPVEVAATARSLCLHVIASYAQRAEKMKELIGKMTEASIDHLLFKGYLVREMYPLPELRSFSDIDFVIRPEDREKSDALMVELGFEREADWEPVYSYGKGAEFYEIHTKVMEVDISDKADYQEYFRHFWDYTVKQDSHTYVFRPEFHLLFLLTHIAKHIYSSGAGIRMYLDIAFFLKYYQDKEFDWDFFLRECDRIGFRDYANTVFTMIQAWFGVEAGFPLKPMKEEMIEEFLEFTMEGGTFGRNGRSASVNYLRQQDQNDQESVSKLGTLKRRLFPSVDRIKGRYTYLEKAPWLLPFAWIHRLIKTREKLGYHMDQAKGIMNADEEEVLKYKRIYKEIGL